MAISEHDIPESEATAFVPAFQERLPGFEDAEVLALVVPETVSDVLADEAKTPQEGGEGSTEGLAEIADITEIRRAITELFASDSAANVIVAETAPATVVPLPLPETAEVATPTAPKRGLLTKARDLIEAYRAQPDLKTRQAEPGDLEAMVDLDMKVFSDVYAKQMAEKGQNPEAFRAELREKFAHRLDIVSDWTRIVMRDGKMVGFLQCCPTNKTPEEFESWEQTTDNGTLETTYDPEGENIYIVSLSMGKEAGLMGRNMAFANLIGKFVEKGHEQAFFESRLPGLRKWANRQLKEGQSVDDLTEDEKFALANEYFQLRKLVKKNGEVVLDKHGKPKEVAQDALIRIFEGVGCKFTRVAADAYDDEPSMNFGVVAVYENPLPRALQNSRIASWAIGKAVRLASRSPLLMEKAF